MPDALLEAIQARDVERLAELLAAGADPNEHGKSRYGSGREAPLCAVIGELEPAGPIDAVVLLLRHGAVVHRSDASREGVPLLMAVLIKPIEAVRLLHCGAGKTIDEGGGSTGMNALGFAATRLDVDMVRLLLAHGASPEARDLDKRTPLDRLRNTSPPGGVKPS